MVFELEPNLTLNTDSTKPEPVLLDFGDHKNSIFIYWMVWCLGQVILCLVKSLYLPRPLDLRFQQLVAPLWNHL